MIKKYNVLIIGAGKIGSFFDTPNSDNVLSHAHAVYVSKYFDLLGFYDANFESAKAASELWNCKYFQELPEALSRAEIVCCAVPDEYHYDILNEIVKYKNIIAVFAEKPITKTLKEAEKIVDLYNKNNIKLIINYSRRFFKEYEQLKKTTNQYGLLLSGIAYYGKGIKHNGSHMVDLIQYLLGDIKKYKVDNKIYDFFDDDPSVEGSVITDKGTIILKPIDCSCATIFELDLIFEKGRIRLLDNGYLVEVYEVRDSKIYSGYKNYIIKEQFKIDISKALNNAYDNIYQIVSDEKEIISSSINAKNVLEICNKMGE